MGVKYFILIAVLAISAFAHSESSIHMTDRGFEPRVLEIELGTNVEFENIGENDRWPASNIHPTHEIYSDFDPKEPISPGKSWTFTFDKAGVWRFHDHLNPEFTGKITVRGDGDTFVIRLRNFIVKLFPSKITAAVTALLPDPRYNESIAEDSEQIFHDDDSLYSYVKKFGPEKATLHLSSLENKFGECHQTAHRGGRFAYEIHGEKAFQLCTAECHSGCYHGAIEAYFKEHGTENMDEAFKAICGSNKNNFHTHQCFHGLGHGLMAWSDYELFEALESCDLLKEWQYSCYSGVFMENVIGSLAEGHETKYLSDDPLYPCNIVDEKYKAECYFFQTSRMIVLFDYDFEKVIAACLDAPERYHRDCFSSLGRDISGVFSDINISIEICGSISNNTLRNECLIGAVQDTFWDAGGQDVALEFCRLLEKGFEKDECYKTVFDRGTEVIGLKDEYQNFCAKAETEYQEKCLEKISAFNN